MHKILKTLMDEDPKKDTRIYSSVSNTKMCIGICLGRHSNTISHV